MTDPDPIDALQAADAPDFVLSDVHGKPVRFSDYRRRKAVVLVFNRGAT